MNVEKYLNEKRISDRRYTTAKACSIASYYQINDEAWAIWERDNANAILFMQGRPILEFVRPHEVKNYVKN